MVEDLNRPAAAGSTVIRATREDGTGLLLTERLGLGGEGAVYRVHGSALVAKLVLRPRDGARHPVRIRRLINQGRSPRTSRLLADSPRRAAWPLAMLRTGDDAIRGFVMADMTAWYEPFEAFLSTESRRRVFPGASWALSLRAAAALARLVADLHEERYVLGDLKSENLWLDRTGRVGVSDVDSFQFTDGGDHFPCHARSPGYTAPEAIDAPDRPADEDGDRFALAVLVYQLVMAGTHPYFGVPADGGHASIDDNILHGRSLVAAPGSVRVPAGTPDPALLPEPLAGLFRRAFGPVGADGPPARPAAAEWLPALRAVAGPGGLRRCGSGRPHWYPAGSPRCPWCDLADQGHDCFPIASLTTSPPEGTP